MTKKFEKEREVKERALAERDKWKAEALNLRAHVEVSAEITQKENDSLKDENKTLKKRLIAMEEDLRATKVDLKFTSMTGRGWGKDMEEAPLLDDSDEDIEDMEGLTNAEVGKT